MRSRTTLPLVACALASAAALAACGGDTKTVTVDTTITRPTTAGPTTTGTTSAPPAPVTTTAPGTTVSPNDPGPATATVSLSSFRAPSSNIGCVLADGTARCDIRQRSWSPPPRPSSCNLDYGQGLTVGGGGATFVCAGDTALDPTAAVLPYGQDSRVGAIRCASRQAGITCIDTATGHGFFIARERYRLF